MYEINDKTSAIKAVQRLLGENQSGIYGDRTRDAVKKSQRAQGAEENGIVDYATFTALADEFYLEAIRGNAGKSDGVLRFPYSLGMGGADVSRLHEYLGRALELYRYESIKPKGSYYNAATENAVIFLRNVFRLREGRDVDEVFYSRLKREIFSQ